MARIYTQRTRKEGRICGRCGDEIKKGEQYRSAAPGFRGRTLIRCMKPQCSFRQSELTTSKMSAVYAAIEDAEDQLAEVDDVEEIETIMQEAADAIRGVGQEYADASDQWAGGAGNEEFQEKADELEAAADEIEGFDLEEPEVDETDEEYVQRIVEAAMEHLGNASIP